MSPHDSRQMIGASWAILSQHHAREDFQVPHRRSWTVRRPIALSALAVLLAVSAPPSLRAQPGQGENGAAAAPNRWWGTHRTVSGMERAGWFEVVAGRFVFSVGAEDGAYAWNLPLRSLRNVTRDGKWVVLEGVRQRSAFSIGVLYSDARFHPRDIDADVLTESLRRLATDPSVVSSGDGLALLKDVMTARPKALIVTMDGQPLWTQEKRQGPSIYDRAWVPASLLQRRLDVATGVQWVAPHLALAPGPHSLSVGLSGTRPRVCTVDFDAERGHTYVLTHEGELTAVKNETSGRVSPGRCNPSVTQRDVATLDVMGVPIGDIDGWKPWLRVGSHVFVNPHSGSGVGWMQSQRLYLRPGTHTLSVAYYERTSYAIVYSTADCPLRLAVEAGKRYSIHNKASFDPSGHFRTWVEDETRNTVASCGKDD